jgi:leader peptidase (prepilin peptidase)/N-methyltransferase
VEAFSGILTVLVFFKFLHPELLLGGFPHFFSSNIQLFEKFHFSHYASFFISLWLLYTGIPLTLIDLKYRILPDVITLPGTLIGFFISCLNPEMGWLESLVGILVGSGGLFLISKLYQVFRKREGMGLGDVKYLGFIGAVLGWQGALFTLFIASILGSLFGIAIGIINKKGLSTTIPFGPFLACAALTVSLYSKEILLFYL